MQKQIVLFVLALLTISLDIFISRPRCTNPQMRLKMKPNLVSSGADHFRCNSSIVVIRLFFHIVMLALWSTTLIAANIAFWFLSLCIGFLLGAAAGGKSEISCV